MNDENNYTLDRKTRTLLGDVHDGIAQAFECQPDREWTGEEVAAVVRRGRDIALARFAERTSD